MQLKASVFCIFFVLSCLLASAQHLLLVQVNSEADKKVLESFSYKTRLSDSIDAQQQINQLLRSLREDGYLLAGMQKMNMAADTSRALLTISSQYRWAKLSATNVNENWLNNTLWRQRLFEGKPFRYKQVSALMQQLVGEAENNGYPFASVKLDSVEINEALLVANVNVEQGPYIIFDTLVMEGSARLSPKFLEAHLGIRYGDPYSQQRVKDAAALLGNLPYIRLQKEPVLTFQNRQATLHLDLEDKRSNVVDGVIGLLPDPQEAGRLMFTGQFDLLLQNPFGGGKKIALHWQRLERNSQNLEAAYFHPYLFGSLISLNGNFSLLKEEENFVNRQLDLELQLRQGGSNIIRILAKQKDSRLLAAGQDPGFASFSLAQFGLGFMRQQLDDPQTPQRGYHFSLDFTGGNKSTRSVPVKADSTQQAIPGTGMQYRGAAMFRYFWPLGPHFVWAHTLEAGLIKDNRLFINDLYRLGGLSSLRGFREKRFFASDYLISRGELRYLASRDTYLFMFYDQSWMEQKIINLHETDWPLGFGAGLSLATSSGTFNFVYGLGKSEKSQLSLNQSQVHFGYVNRF